MTQALFAGFLGEAPPWYKRTIVLFLLLNPVLFTLHPYAAGWALVLEFIFTLAMALRCYPLQPGGLLALEAVAIGMTSPEQVFAETVGAVEVLLLLIFMVAGIYFLKDLLRFAFMRILARVRSKLALALLFCLSAALLSAFLDALTVIAVVIAVATGFYGVYHRVASGRRAHEDHDETSDHAVAEQSRADLDGFRAFLRGIVMHAAVGTTLGGVMTLVGEPQNLLIGTVAGWSFLEFFVHMAPVSVPVLLIGAVTCLALERLQWFGYGTELPPAVRAVLEDFERRENERRTPRERAALLVQTVVAVFLVVALAFHWAAVGLVGLAVIVLTTAFTGIIDEHRIGRAFEAALPFTALVVVFFGIVAVIHDQQLFDPVVAAVLALPADSQPAAFFIANGLLSAISDNVFVATVYINQIVVLHEAGTIDREQFDLLAIAINTGTNIPSIATPNGQAAFLFLLTSALAPLLRLSYIRMVFMALPYFVTMTATALAAVVWWL